MISTDIPMIQLPYLAGSTGWCHPLIAIAPPPLRPPNMSPSVRSWSFPWATRTPTSTRKATISYLEAKPSNFTRPWRANARRRRTRGRREAGEKTNDGDQLGQRVQGLAVGETRKLKRYLFLFRRPIRCVPCTLPCTTLYRS